MELAPSPLPLPKRAPPTADRRSSIEPRAEATETLRIERILAIVRAGLAILVFLAISTYQTEGREVRQLLRFLLFGYHVGAIGLTTYLFRVVTIQRHIPLILHIADIGVAAGVTLFLDGLGSPMFVFLIYPILAGAYRWSVAGVLVTAVLLEAMFVGYALRGTPHGSFEGIGLQANTLLLLVGPIPVIGGLAGYLTYMERQRRREEIDLGTVLRSARFTGEFDQTVALVLGSLLKMFSAATIMLVITDRRSGATFLWRAGAADHGAPANEQMELNPAQLMDYFFDLAGGAGCEVDLRRRTGWFGGGPARVFDGSGRRMPDARPVDLPPGFLRSHPFTRLACVSLNPTESWAGRLFVLEPGRRMTWRGTARLAVRICRELDPHAHGLYRVHHLRTRAQAVERSRIARELHDGVTQSLLGAEMLIAVLRHRIPEEAPAISTDLLRIHDVVRQSIVGLREVCESGHLLETSSGDPLVDLEEIVDRFQRHTGIQAKFISDGQRVSLTLHRQSELARLVHEGLVNVRKHSGAQRVIVRSVVLNGCWSVSLEDDGRGFAFAGRRTQAQLDQRREGPRTIIERATRMGAEVTVESTPGSGSRVEIAIRLLDEP